ncbi:serine hydrolase domain-containing protein [Kitasatospora cineracea]
MRSGPLTTPAGAGRPQRIGETMAPSSDRIHQLLADGVRDRAYPGAVWAVGDPAGFRAGGTVGVLDPARPEIPMLPDTVFDVASLTKILAVWSTAGALWEDGLLPLDEPLGAFWPEVTGHPLGRATARNLLTHTAGLPLRAQLKNLYGTDPAAVREGVLHGALHRRPGEAVDYTDRAAPVLGYLAEHLSGHPLDRLAAERIWQPLGMDSTRLRPPTRRPGRPERPHRIRRGDRPPPPRHRPRLLRPPPEGRLRNRRRLLHRRRPHPIPPPPAHPLPHRTGRLRPRLDQGVPDRPHRPTDPRTRPVLAPRPGHRPLRRHLGPLRLHRHRHLNLPSQETWAVLLTNKLYDTRDRQPLTDIRNTFRKLAFDERPTRT